MSSGGGGNSFLEKVFLGLASSLISLYRVTYWMGYNSIKAIKDFDSKVKLGEVRVFANTLRGRRKGLKDK